MDKLHSAIEEHFDALLNRNNIRITLCEGNKTLVCKPFNYAKYCKDPFEKEIKLLFETHSKKQRTKKCFDISKTPVKVFLIASKDTDFQREPFFMVKGRKVIEVSKVDQLRSLKKSTIWSRDNVTGSVDVTDILIPNSTRKDFQTGRYSKALFNKLIEIESEIEEYIKKKTCVNHSTKLKNLEDKINNVLKKYFESKVAGESPDGEINSSTVYTINGYNVLSNNKTPVQKKTKQSVINGKTNIHKPRLRDKKVTIKFPSLNSEDSLQNSTLKFFIDDKNEPVKNINGEPLRSVMRDSSIILYRLHDEFQKRLPENSKGSYTINIKLLHYIAMEISIHLTKISLAEEEKSGEIYNVLNSFASDVYELEEAMKSLEGEKI